jgi:HJR/Mrr/RecB family endonuclease|tara:strand:+ start:1676 stop:1978 length:303 start_codon:yes stop_codon:yes gene_type:complete
MKTKQNFYLYTISKQEAKELINNSNGKIFSATFTKKDFTSRLINARLGVKYERKTERKRPYDPAKKDLICVFDMIKKQHRTINLRTLDSLSINKNKFIVL